MFYRWQTKFAPYLFVAPFIVVFMTFGLYPLVKSLILSFYITSGPKAQVFVGLDNIRFLAGDPNFWIAVKNTSIYAFFAVIIQLPLALLLAVVLNSALIRARNIFRFSFFSPHLMGLVFSAILFQLILAPRFGLLNVSLNWLFGDLWPVDFRWLNEKQNVMPALILVSMWLHTGFNMIYFLAALQAVDKNLYEAARVDGAGRIMQFIHVTLPGIKHVAVFVLILATIFSLQLYELAFVLLNSTGEETSGPDQAGLTIVMYLYQNGFNIGDLGYASAIGWTLAITVMLISMVQLWTSGTLKKDV